MKSIVLETKELQVYRCLLGRVSFSRKDKTLFYNVKSGYEGERKLFNILKKRLRNDHIALYGILLENNGTLYQIDCLLIFQNHVIMIEVKNHQGEFEIQEEKFYCITTNRYYQNPLHQLQRSNINLLELLSKLKARIPLKSYVAFVNQEFTLFAERSPTIILPSQINSFIKKLNQIPGKISSRQQKLAEQIIELHVEESPYTRLPEYHFAKMRKGVLCRDCRNLMQGNWKRLSCQNCTYNESTDSGVLRSAIEFNILFPEMKITTGKIAAWCALDISNRSIRRILQAYLRQYLTYKKSYFHFN